MSKVYDEEYQFYTLPGFNDKKRKKLTQNQTNPKKKRKQVKRACVNCRAAHTGCDHERPCKRCVTHGLGDSCVDTKRKVSVKKEDKKKDEEDSDFESDQEDKSKNIKTIKHKKVYDEDYSEEEDEEEEELDEDQKNIKEKKEIEIYNCDTFLCKFEEKFLTELEKDFKSESDSSNEIKEKNIQFPDTCVAVWSLDGTLKSSNKDFNKLFKIPKHLVNYSKYGPHYKKLIHKKNLNYVNNIFDEVFQNKKSSFVGEVDLSPFASDFQFTEQQPVLKCQLCLQIVYGKSFVPKYIVSYITLIE